MSDDEVVSRSVLQRCPRIFRETWLGNRLVGWPFTSALVLLAVALPPHRAGHVLGILVPMLCIMAYTTLVAALTEQQVEAWEGIATDRGRIIEDLFDLQDKLLDRIAELDPREAVDREHIRAERRRILGEPKN